MYLFTNFLLFVLILKMIFFSLPIRISVPFILKEVLVGSAPKKTYIGFKTIITNAITLTIMLFLIFIIFDLGITFKQ